MRLRTCIILLLVSLLAACKTTSTSAPSDTTTEPPPAATDPTEVPDEEAPTASGDTDTPQPADKLPTQGQPCPEGTCAEGMSCLGYYGIAGAQGPRFTSCEIPCAGDPQGCPDGQSCITIADGPGQVCRAQ